MEGVFAKYSIVVIFLVASNFVLTKIALTFSVTLLCFVYLRFNCYHYIHARKLGQRFVNFSPVNAQDNFYKKLKTVHLDTYVFFVVTDKQFFFTVLLVIVCVGTGALSIALEKVRHLVSTLLSYNIFNATDVS